MQPQRDGVLSRINDLMNMASELLSREHGEDDILKAYQKCLMSDTLESAVDSLGWTYKSGQSLTALCKLVFARDVVAGADVTPEDAFLVANAMCDALVCLAGADNDVFRRTGKRQQITRGKSSFTECVEYLIKKCLSENKHELLSNGNILEFLKFAKKLVMDKNKCQDQWLAERIRTVSVNGNQSCIFMKEGYGKERSKPENDPLVYTFKEIQDVLSKLQKSP